MPSLSLHAIRHHSRLHQKSWGATLGRNWRRWRLRWARHSQRKVLLDVALDPHLLADIGVTREEALGEARKSIFEMTDVIIHSL
jgi:uncharacterized protein YjiS (DUF1127 family)